MATGAGLTDALGYSSDGPDPPLWAALAVGGPLTLFAMAPAMLAISWGRRARRDRRSRAATTAVVIGALVTAYWLLTSIAGVAQRL